MMGVAALTMGFAFVSCSSDDGIYNPNADALTDNYQSSFEKNVGKPAAGHTWGFNQTRATRATEVNVNGNEWTLQPEVTAAEAKAVYNYVNHLKKDVEHYTEVFPKNMVNYYVTQVYTGTSKYNCYQDRNNANKTTLGSAMMNHLQIAENGEAYIDENGNLSETGWYHVNNFNASSNINYGGNTIATNSGTFDFAYLNSQDSNYHNEWICVDGKYITDEDGVNHAGKYYVCFDFTAWPDNAYSYFKVYVNESGVQDGTRHHQERIAVKGVYGSIDEFLASGKSTIEYNGKTYTMTNSNRGLWQYDGMDNPNMMYQADTYYTDWIIRLIEAEPDNGGGEVTDTEVLHESGRIFCEDLGTIGDFDFNDVVFDAKVYYWKNAGTPSHTDITLLAAGGTMKITVAGRDVHEAFGQPDSKMINTGDDSKCVKGLDPVPFRAETAYASLIEIPIAVQHGSAVRVLEAQPGKAPQKYVAPIGTKWADEYVNVTKVYPKFKEWVEKENVTPEWANANTILTNEALADNAAELAK